MPQAFSLEMVQVANPKAHCLDQTVSPSLMTVRMVAEDEPRRSARVDSDAKDSHSQNNDVILGCVKKQKDNDMVSER